MLKINKTINLNGNSEIEGQIVAYMSASISTDGGSANISKNISNMELYNANKVAIRTDMAKFEEEAYKVEDELNPVTGKVVK